jgi:hypothetical protein
VKLTGLDTDGDGKEDDLTSSSLFIGQPLSAIYDYKVDGIWQVGDDIPEGYHPGNYKIVDYNKDGEINEKDRHIIGKNDPSVRMGLLNTLKYKDFTLSFFLNAVLGGSKSYLGKNSFAELVNDNTLRHNRLTEQVDNFWTPTNTGTDVPRWNYGDLNTGNTQTRFLTDASYLNLQNINLGYTLPKAFTQKFQVSSLRVYASAENVYYWSKRKGFDPRQSFSETANATRYSPMRTISGGITVTF